MHEQHHELLQSLELVGEYLSEIGYGTFLAASGEAAMKILDDVSPDLLLANFAMPGHTGADIARTIRQRLPKLPIPFAAGSTIRMRAECPRKTICRNQCLLSFMRTRRLASTPRY